MNNEPDSTTKTEEQDFPERFAVSGPMKRVKKFKN